MDTAMTSAHAPAVTPPEVTLIPNNSLLTETPEAGRQLAVKMLTTTGGSRGDVLCNLSMFVAL